LSIQFHIAATDHRAGADHADVPTSADLGTTGYGIELHHGSTVQGGYRSRGYLSGVPSDDGWRAIYVLRNDHKQAKGERDYAVGHPQTSDYFGCGHDSHHHLSGSGEAECGG